MSIASCALFSNMLGMLSIGLLFLQLAKAEYQLNETVKVPQGSVIFSCDWATINYDVTCDGLVNVWVSHEAECSEDHGNCPALASYRDMTCVETHGCSRRFTLNSNQDRSLCLVVSNAYTTGSATCNLNVYGTSHAQQKAHQVAIAAIVAPIVVVLTIAFVVAVICICRRRRNVTKYADAEMTVVHPTVKLPDAAVPPAAGAVAALPPVYYGHYPAAIHQPPAAMPMPQPYQSAAVMGNSMYMNPYQTSPYQSIELGSNYPAIR